MSVKSEFKAELPNELRVAMKLDLGPIRESLR